MLPATHTPVATRTETIPPLQSGDRLSRDAFESIYHAHPELKKAELIEGVVYVASPVRFELHASPRRHRHHCNAAGADPCA